jgi:homoserine O-succinyltransferase
MNKSSATRSIRDRSAGSPAGFRESDARCLDIALINNMPSAALEGAERQFGARVEAAAGDVQVRLTFYTFPEIPRTEAARQRISLAYSSMGELWDAHYDGLIVTGAEPCAPRLEEEAYWETMTRLIDWARHNTYSAIWSCLAAHAAVLYLDGIFRHRLENKCSGVFECARLSDHELVSSVPARFHMPHSRWNEIPQRMVAASGYALLSGSEQAGVDAFAKNGSGRSLFVFFQGHPEYDAETLLLEYRRDIGRFLRGEYPNYPCMPQGYFDRDTVKKLAAFQKSALRDRREERLGEFPTTILASKVRNTWSPTAIGIYRNWLRHICEQKEEWMKTRARRSEPAVRGARQAA